MSRAIEGVAAAALALSVAACGHNPTSTYSWGSRHYANLSERDCMARAMYFESNRSSEEGMKAVGTVVMNRVKSGQYSSNICNVVGAPRQFAPGVLSKPVTGASWALAQRSADAILRGERHARVGRAMHFHTAGYTFPYRNMAYVVAAGGNVFYEKRTPGSFTPVHPNVFVAEARNRPVVRPSEQIVLARAEAPEAAPAPMAAPAPVAAPVSMAARAPMAAPAPKVERVRLASLEDREPVRAARAAAEPRRISARHEDEPSRARTGHGRRQLAQQVEEAPRPRAKPERIRLAHLDDSDMPKALRQRSDAAPSGGMAGMPLPYRNAGPDPKAQGRTPIAMAQASGKPAPAAASSNRPAAKPETRAARMPSAGPAKAAGVALPYRDAKAKPGGDALARAGWHKGPEPAAAKADKPKKRS